MPALLLSFFLSLCQYVQACEVNPRTSIYSLSGPVTVLLEELKLLNSPQLKGISIFHPVAAGEFKGEVLAGGVFLGHRVLSQLKGSVVFFDESQELSRIFKLQTGLKSFEVKTRGLLPLEVTDRSLEILQPFLSGCESRIEHLKRRHQERANQLLKIIPLKTFVFFLGELRERMPDLIMVNDGIVKWLVQQKKIRTYPSDLAYVNWSAKLMASLPSKTVRVGIVDSGKELKKNLKKIQQGFNLTYPGVLIPGISQIEGFIFLFESI